MFFGAAGVGGRQRVHALVSRSTTGIRRLMCSDPYNLQFSVPLFVAPSAAQGMAGKGAEGGEVDIRNLDVSF